jgi:hypothetical protein
LPKYPSFSLRATPVLKYSNTLMVSNKKKIKKIKTKNKRERQKIVDRERREKREERREKREERREKREEKREVEMIQSTRKANFEVLY